MSERLEIASSSSETHTKRSFAICVRHLKEAHFELVISLYISTGLVVFILSHALGAIYFGMMNLPTYDFTVNEALLATSLWFPIVCLTLWLTIAFCKNHFSNIYGVLLVLPVLAVLGSISLFTINNGLNPYNIAYLFVLIALLGITLYLYFNKRKNVEVRGKIETYTVEALKMEHATLLQQLNQTIWAIVFVFIGAAITGLLPVASLVGQDAVSAEATRITLVGNAILIIYFLVGSWFGIIHQLQIRLEEIRQNMLSLDKPQEC